MSQTLARDAHEVDDTESRGTIARFQIESDERSAIEEILDEVVPRTRPLRVPVEDQLERVRVLSHRLPERLRTVFAEFEITGRPRGGMVVRGMPVREDLIGATPTSYSDVVDRLEVHRAGAALMLVGSLLGHPFSFLSQQYGRLVLDVFPVAQHRSDQLGSSSDVELEWHNEDAFHEDRADWIVLICLRNPDRAPTTFGRMHDLELTARTRELLFERRYVILPDESHTQTFNRSTTGVDESGMQSRAFEQIDELNRGERRIAILSGSPENPMIRIDPAYMQRSLGDEAAESALDEVISSVDRQLIDVPLETGDLLVIDNKRAVHGRRPFEARYDGTDRWLRRANLLSDLRRLHGRLGGSHGRAVA